MREKIDLPGLHDPAQVGMRSQGCSCRRLVIRQGNEGRMLAIGKEAHPSFDPIHNVRREFGVAREGKNHKVRAGGRARSQLKGLPGAEHGKAEHQVAEVKVSVKSASQSLVKIAGMFSAGEVLVNQYGMERWPSLNAEAAGCVVWDGSVYHRGRLLAWGSDGNWRKAPTPIGAVTTAVGCFPSLGRNPGGPSQGQSKLSSARRRRSARSSFST